MVDLSEFDFELPKHLIAQRPAVPRDHAKLLVYRRDSGEITDDYFYNLDKYLPKATTLVLNDSKVEKCRLRFGSAEIFVLETINPKTVRAWVKPGKKFRSDAKVDLNALKVKVISIGEDGSRILELSKSIDDKSLNKFRLTPFPPYIKPDEKLADEYQTVYSKPEGSKAAPTAGLHFTPKLLSEISKTHPVARLTLHVGLGTFAPLRQDNLESGRLHAERFEINNTTAKLLNQATYITAVGTTSLRVLETVDRPFEAKSGQTDIFIRPGYKFKVVNSLITNFHLPKSSLLMLVTAFIGSPQETQRIYKHAIECRYRFYSFGDAMLIL